MSEHTKTPWKFIETISSCKVIAGKKEVLHYAYNPSWENRANARHIVHCVNNHERLVDQLKDCLELMEDSERRYEQGQDAPNMNDEIKYTRELLATLEAEKGGEL